MFYGLECWALNQVQLKRLQVIETKGLSLLCMIGITRTDRVRRLYMTILREVLYVLYYLTPTIALKYCYCF